MNLVILVGRLGQPPQIFQTEGNKTIGKLRIATKELVDGQEGVEWHDVVCWETLAKTCFEQLKKGDRVLVRGRIHTNEWTDSSGQNKVSKQIIAERIEFLFDKKNIINKLEDNHDL